MRGTVSRYYYLIAAFFVLDTMEAFGFLSRMIYGMWPGSDKVTQSLNLLMIAASLTLLFSYRRSKKGFARAVSWPSRRSASWVFPPFGRWTRRRPSGSPSYTYTSSLARSGWPALWMSTSSCVCWVVLFAVCNRFDPPARCLPRQCTDGDARRCMVLTEISLEFFLRRMSWGRSWPSGHLPPCTRSGSPDGGIWASFLCCLRSWE